MGTPPPFAGEPHVALVSQGDGSYRQRLRSTESRCFHGGATCYPGRDGDVELSTADGTVLDFTVPGTGPTRTLWVLRTSGGVSTSYVGNVLQRVDPRMLASQIAFSSRQVEQLAWEVRVSP